MAPTSQITGSAPQTPDSAFPRGGDNLAARPRGPLARPMAAIMARHNAPITRLAVEQLDPRPDDTILDIGFGPGHSVELLAGYATAGLVAGVDVSDDMVRAAIRRNHAAVAAGRVSLVAGSVAHLPFDDHVFTKVMASNTVQFWPDPAHDLREVRRVMRPGALLVLGLRRRSGRGIGYRPQDAWDLALLVRSAGFDRTGVVEADKALAVHAVS